MNLRLWRHYLKNQAILKTQVTKNKNSNCDYDLGYLVSPDINHLLNTR